MRTLAEDTHSDAERVLIELLRAAAPARKMAMMLDANRTARTLALTGLRERHPNDSPARLRRRLADLWLGPVSRPGLTVPGQPMSEADTELLAAAFFLRT